jgi:hypothetical protein
VAPSHPQQIPFSSLQQVERLICPSSQGDLPAINAPQIEPQWIHLFQQKAAAAKVVTTRRDIRTQQPSTFSTFSAARGS